MLHCAPGFDDIEHNVHMLDELVRAASRLMPDLIVTPELAVSGYGFAQVIGTAWIGKRIPDILERFGRLASDVGSALVLGCPRLDGSSGGLYNTAIFYDKRGTIRGFQNKLSVVACDGARVLVYAGKRPAILSFVVDAKWCPIANSWAVATL